MGDYDLETNTYLNLNYDHFKWSIDQAEALLQRFGSHPAVFAYEPINEPWVHSEIGPLKYFYR
jgi:hypothetical protein